MYGLPKRLLSKLQSIQNSAARIVTWSRKYDHITPLLVQLHWLPVHHQIVFKNFLLVYKSINGACPVVCNIEHQLDPSAQLQMSFYWCLLPKVKLMVTDPSLYVLQKYGTNFHTVCGRHPVYRLLKRISKLIFLNFLLVIVPCIFLLIDVDVFVSF
jgi:hypothetical protein